MASRKMQKEIEGLKGDIVLKDETIKYAQRAFAEELKNGLGDSIKNNITIKPTKESKWKTLLHNLNKILNQN